MKRFRKLLLILVVMTAISSAFAFSASAAEVAYGAATVSASTLNVRSGPGTDRSVVMTLSENDIVVILERTNNEWYYINFHGTKGYVNVPYLKDILTRENFNAMGRVTGEWVFIRSAPSTYDDILATYPVDTVMTVIGINNGWYKVKHEGFVGYMRSDNMEIIAGHRAASSSESSAPKQSTSSSSQQSAPPSQTAMTKGEQIANFALNYVGSRYVSGGASPSGFDCSGLTYYTYKNFGQAITRNASGQYKNDGVKISKSELIPGDLVFFSSNGGKSVTHVGIYIGDNEFVHASTSSTGVIISRLDSTYYINAWFGAKRVFS